MILQNTIFWQKQTAPRCVIKTHVAVQKEKIGRRAIIYTIISRCSDAHSHLIFERNDGIRTGYAPEAESRTWSSRLYCDGDIPPLYPVSLSLLKVCAKLAKQDEAAKDSRSHFVHTFQAPFTSRSHFAQKTHLPLYQSVD